MVAQVGPLEVAAQGNGAIWQFTIVSFLFGILTMVNGFVAQAVGADRPREVARYAWAGMWLSLAAWVFVLLPFAFVLPSIFAAMGHEERLVELESRYAAIMLAGGVAALLGKAISNFFFGIHRPKLVTVAAIVGNLVNIVLNYALIYGEEGLPRFGLPGVPGVPAMGVAGAAVATVIGVAVEAAIPLAVFLGRDLDRRYGIRAAWRPECGPIRDLLRVGWPNAMQFGNEIVCWALFMSWLVGLFGTLHLTAGWITLRYMHMSFMPAVGFAVATTSLVGRYVGGGRPDLAAHRARVAVCMALAYMTVCGILLGIFRHELIGFFAWGSGSSPEEAAEVVRIGGWMMICAAVFQTFDAVGIVYSGALRGAGDTVVPGLLTVGLSWFLIVGLGWLLATRLPEWESFGPWLAASVYIIALGFAMGGRFESARWQSIQLVARDRGTA
jgi:MATE family multidrug resistance protein